MLTWAWFCFLTCMNCVSFVVCWRVRLIADTQTFLNVLSVRSAGRETVGGLGFEWIHLWTKWSTTSDFCGDLIFERTETDKDFFFVVLLLNNITVDFNQSTHDRSYEWTCKKHQFLCTVANFQVTCWNVIGRCSNDYKWKKKTEMKKDQNVHVKVQKCTWVGHAANKHVTGRLLHWQQLFMLTFRWTETSTVSWSTSDSAGVFQRMSTSSVLSFRSFGWAVLVFWAKDVSCWGDCSTLCAGGGANTHTHTHTLVSLTLWGHSVALMHSWVSYVHV